MNGQSNGFTATQTNKGFHVVCHDESKEFEISIHDFNEFANKYAQDTLQGKKPELSEKEEIIISIWEMVLMQDSTIH